VAYYIALLRIFDRHAIHIPWPRASRDEISHSPNLI